MSPDPVTLGLITTTALSAGGAVVQGVQQSQAAKANAAQQRVQTAEAVRQKKREQDTFLARQRSAFRKGGVTMEGTPMQVLGSTAGLFAEETQMIKARGRAGVQANKRAAKSYLIGGVTQGASTLASGASFFGGGG